MAFRIRRRLTTRRRKSRRTMRRMRRPGLSKRALSVHHFKRTFVGTPISSQTTTLYGGYVLTFDQLPNYTEFTNLFDLYRINKVLIKFIPNQSESSVGAAKAIPEFFSCIDFTDGTAPTSINQILEYANMKITRGIYTHKRTYTPSTVDYVNATAGANAGNPTWKQWLSTSSSSVSMYGLKYAAGPTAAAGDVFWTPYVTMYFSCKSTK